MYLAYDNWHKRGVLDKSEVRYSSAGNIIFGVKVFAEALVKVV